MGELMAKKRSLAHRLESAHGRQPRRWEHRRATRSFTQYGSHKEEEDWRLNHFEERRQHLHLAPKISLSYVKIPSFSGDGDRNIYLGWEAKVEQIFNVHGVQEDQKVKLASLECLDYAMQWWHKTVMHIVLNKRPVVVSWEDLKLCMHARFVPPHYRKELLLKLQQLQQGTKNVDDYFNELETTLTKIDMHESEKSKMARFVSGLRREIQDVVELYEYSSLEKLVHLAIKVETQLSKKIHFKNSHNDGYYQSA